jgi:hypothetical protein
LYIKSAYNLIKKKILKYLHTFIFFSFTEIETNLHPVQYHISFFLNVFFLV